VKRKKEHKRSSEAGFTLIELLIVIAIIGAFLMIALPTYKGAVANAQTRSCEVNKRMVVTTLEAYAAENGGSYPAAATALQSLVDAGYLREAPECPLKGTYTVEVSADGKKITVKCSKHDSSP
jgi:prepilin-type N-terminal cleavage/methylation domain-containing protein